MSKPEPEQFTLDREDKIRKDLEARITALDQKIELNDRLARIETKVDDINKPQNPKH